MKREIDISTISYDEWLTFVFDHPVPDNALQPTDWYWEFNYEVSNVAQLIKYVTDLCNSFSKVSEIYSLPQLDQGIWFVIGPCIDFGQYLRNKDVSIDLRQSCVRAMYWVYADFVSKRKLQETQTCFWMWWDLLPQAFYIKGDTGHFDDDSKEMEGTILETLSSILQLQDITSQRCALHGLGHLKHPKAREVVGDYIDEHGGEWNEEGRQWLETCREGTVE
ncbi:MAG: hypothetical protein C5B44_05980 [Acidobacteria bacterium]|nr:MAG: hypothetical protein C5B44_05980 [Acidobacteriota bacterium]